MLAPLLTVVLCAAPPPASQARTLAAKEQWDELYLAFAAVKADGYSGADRALVAQALAKGCHALEGQDAALASALGDKAVQLVPTEDALLCLGRSSRATQQHEAAENAFREGRKRFPKRAIFALELGKLLWEEKDAAGALEALRAVPRTSKEAVEAKRLIAQASSQDAQERGALREAQALERRISGGAASEPSRGGRVEAAVGGERERRGRPQSASLSYESGAGPGGMRTRANSRFVLKYFNNDRDFGQRADYEGQVVSALDEAYETSVRVLGQARQSPVDVVLYTREEFIANFSASTARKVAGLYSMDSIRVNDAAELTQQNRATLVHEYIHAVVDDLASGQAQRLPTWFNEGLAEAVEWRYLGVDGVPLGYRTGLRNMDKAGQLPSLRQMDRGMLVNDPNPAASYAFSAAAVQQLLARGGPSKLLELVRSVGRGEAFEGALANSYGLSLDELQEAARQELAHR